MKNKRPAALFDLCYGRSRHMATPIPPPIQKGQPFLCIATLHFREACLRCALRGSDGVTSAMAPPFTFTISGSHPISLFTRPALPRLHWPQRGQDQYGPSRFIQRFAAGIDRANTHDGRVKANSGKKLIRANGLMPRFSASPSPSKERRQHHHLDQRRLQQ